MRTTTEKQKKRLPSGARLGADAASFGIVAHGARGVAGRRQHYRRIKSN
jgi:hypothetical protein